MPSPPDSLLVVRLSGAGRAVLCALWSCAVPEGAGEAFVALRTTELVAKVNIHRSSVQRAVAALRQLGLVDRVRRRFAGREVPGWRLLPVPLRQSGAPARVTTRKGATQAVAVREKPPASEGGSTQAALRADMLTIATHARRGDSEVTIADRLLRVRARCSEGVWHKIKVHRRISAMRRELGIGPGTKLPAGDVVFRWKMVNDA